MDIKNIKRANEIKEELDDLDYFIKNINGRWNETKMFLKIKNTFSYSVFGSRYFGGGSHEKEIKIPSTIIDKITSEAILWKNELENEMRSL